MRNETFDIPVTVETDLSGHEHVVTDTIQAAEILLRRWPDDGRGEKYKSRCGPASTSWNSAGR
jgi:hypothetical protein